MITFLILLYNCKKEDIKCPGFPESQRVWLPYSVGDSITFITEKDTMCFTISKLRITKPYTMERNNECECDASYFMKSHIEENKLLSLSGEMGHPGVNFTPLIVYIDITKYDTLCQDCNNYLWKEGFYLYEMAEFDYFDSIIYNNSILTEKVTIYNVSNTHFGAITLVKYVGITEIHEGDTVWKLLE
jgi:hypothetical protein